jgi:hypothetical protein
MTCPVCAPYTEQLDFFASLCCASRIIAGRFQPEKSMLHRSMIKNQISRCPKFGTLHKLEADLRRPLPHWKIIS